MNDISKLLRRKQTGDIKVVAKILNTSPENVHNLLRRLKAKRHNLAVDTLQKVIESREELINRN